MQPCVDARKAEEQPQPPSAEAGTSGLQSKAPAAQKKTPVLLSVNRPIIKGIKPGVAKAKKQGKLRVMTVCMEGHMLARKASWRVLLLSQLLGSAVMQHAISFGVVEGPRMCVAQS